MPHHARRSSRSLARRSALGMLVMVLGLILSGAAMPRAQSTPETMRIQVGAEPDGTEVDLDVDIYRPDGGEAPAVLISHGFGGEKGDLVDLSQTLADAGYVVLAYTARGFGESGGRVHLNDPDFEIADAQVLIDTLADDEQVLQDAPGDPKVGVVGGSYSGAMALMTAGVDERVDSVVAQITWNDLADAFYPQAAADVQQTGPFKKLWASAFYLSALTSSAGDASGSLCGRFDPALCEKFKGAMEGSEADADLIAELRTHSPAPTLDQVSAPTYLVQGMSDSLFGLDQADATATALLRADVPVAVNWFNGGHDGQVSASTPSDGTEDGGPPGDDGATLANEPTDEAEEQTQDVLTWLEGTLRAEQPVTRENLPLPAFSYVMPPPSSGQAAQAFTLDAYPALASGGAGGFTSLPLAPVGPTELVSPPGGVPEAVTSVPGLGSVPADVSTYALSALPGQSLAFDTEPLTREVLVAGAPQVSFDVTSSAQTSTLFVSLWEVQPGGPVLPRKLVAPVKVDLTPGQSERIVVALPGGTWSMATGSTWRVLVSATDGTFRVSPETRIDDVQLAQPELLVPAEAEAVAVAAPSRWDGETIGVASALAALLVLLAILGVRARTRPHPVLAELVDVPLVVNGLTKAYADGHLAVDDVSWRAEKGQVVGLLGPNGAGKTTTLRMVMGLIAQDSGTVHVLGQPVYAGAPVLQRVGALVEGPGALPHLTGRDNLSAYWAATGRPPAEARFDDALTIAALGDAVDRPVKSYSHGMRQRLGIAQAMLGMPEVLILDEPTNGLDPPQIAAMRPMLKQYAQAGRTVVISSHLLAEVEMTCSHVVVMHAGKVLAAGSVHDVGVAEGRNLESVFLSTIAGAADGAELNAVRPR